MQNIPLTYVKGKKCANEQPFDISEEEIEEQSRIRKLTIKSKK